MASSILGTWKGFPNWTFRRGRDGATANYPACQATGGFILGGFPANNTPQTDMGAVRLNCSVSGSFGNGYYPLVGISTGVQAGIDGLYIVGYPITAQGNNVLGQQWEHNGRLIYDTSFLKTLNVDTSGGLWAIPCSQWGWYYCQVGVHKGDQDFLFGSMNVGHQFTHAGITTLANFRAGI